MASVGGSAGQSSVIDWRVIVKSIGLPENRTSRTTVSYPGRSTRIVPSL